MIEIYNLLAEVIPSNNDIAIGATYATGIFMAGASILGGTIFYLDRKRTRDKTKESRQSPSELEKLQ